MSKGQFNMDHPLPLRPDASRIPEELKGARRWVPAAGNWVVTEEYTKLRKTPLAPPPQGGYAMSNNPAHWRPFEDALTEVERRLDIGSPSLLFYVIDPKARLVFGDLDGVVKDGVVDEEAWKDVEQFTYIEISPSGTGLRWIARGDLVDKVNQENSTHTRAVHTNGYISLTGQLVQGRGEITDQTDCIRQFEALCNTPNTTSDRPPPPQETAPPPVNTDDLSLSPMARELLEQGRIPPPGKRSDVVQAVANALAGDLGFTPEQVYSVLVHVPAIVETALERRHGRHHAGLQWLWGVACASADARVNFVGDWVPMVFTGPVPVGMDVFTEVQVPPAVLVDGLIPCDVFGWVGAGGSAKTTLMLWTMVHVILGLPICGREVHYPGPCVLITAEDDAPLVRFRLRAVCDALDLTPAQREQVARHFYMEDVTGQLVRFVEADRNNNMMMTPAVTSFIEAYRNVAPTLVAADPAIYFGPGERHVNDSEAALMAAGRRIGAALGSAERRAAFGLIHHVSQVVAREGIVDQYASRGGTAFADNSRGQVVFSRHTKDNPAYPTPKQILPSAVDEGRVLRLHIPKFSYGALSEQPIWVVRGTGENAFSFTVYEGISPKSPEVEQARKAERRQRMLEDARTVYDFIEREAQDGVKHTSRGLRDHAERMELPVGRIRAAIEFLLGRQYVATVPLPRAEQQGQRKTYLRTEERP